MRADGVYWPRVRLHRDTRSVLKVVQVTGDVFSCITKDQFTCPSLSYTHYWYDVDTCDAERTAGGIVRKVGKFEKLWETRCCAVAAPIFSSCKEKSKQRI